MIVVLNPNCQSKLTDNIHSSLLNANSSSVRLDYWPNFVHTQPGLFSNTFMDNNESENSDVLSDSLAKSFYSKTRTFSRLLSSHYTHNCKSIFRKVSKSCNFFHKLHCFENSLVLFTHCDRTLFILLVFFLRCVYSSRITNSRVINTKVGYRVLSTVSKSAIEVVIFF
ncbi:hypothetical protein Smp_191880 [Schistosoma mansoni]|uniref:hypothetical protein n=1 Tax=Schistosoma mansoni TaxID=6183 RepID=UPI00022DC8DE|nr:hypothetical protein Smp_191880 [Schistosoma mansoni]|eukprot:XP_018647732.1 hypothetical protein Smp_191880 [Schistosoma mansoni]